MKSQVVIAFDHTFLMTCLKYPFLYVLSSTIYHILPYIIYIYIYIIYLLNGLSPSKPPLVSQLRCSCCSCSLMKSLREFSGQSTWAVTHPALVYIYIYIYIWNLMGITGWRSTYPSEKYESAGIIIPNIWKNNPNVPNHQPYIYMYI